MQNASESYVLAGRAEGGGVMEFKDFLLALSEIKDMCSRNQYDCTNCCFYSEDFEECKISCMPERWEVE